MLHPVCSFPETLRMNPQCDYAQRYVTDDYFVPGTNLFVQKGVNIVIPIWQLHFDPNNFLNSFAFQPERFKEDSDSRGKNVYLPFGPGLCGTLGSYPLITYCSYFV